MRYLKWIAVILLAGFGISEMVLNIEVLNQDILLRLALPWYPLGYLLLPMWTALLLLFIAGFILAVTLEIGAWYQYTRTIRLQRQQIKGLQDALERGKPAAGER